MPEDNSHTFQLLADQKFQDPARTAKGETRAQVELQSLETLWLNTGSLCNIECANCYMESGPKKDDLAYLGLNHVQKYLDEIKSLDLPVREIGITGGEPFMNPDIIAILDVCLSAGFSVLVLTNAMKPLWQKREDLKDIGARFGDKLTLRISIDHHTEAHHDEERGPGSWQPMLRGLSWLIENGFNIDVAGRNMWNESDADAREGYQKLFDAIGLKLDANDHARLMLFPEMDETQDVPEITTMCWELLGVRPEAQMCATARMVVLKKGALEPHIMPCTLLPYDVRFEMGPTLQGALEPVALNHPHCARFCVLGGASCSAA